MRRGALAHIGGIVRQLREARGWTQEQLAEYAHVSQSYISMIERDHRISPSAEIMARIAKALNTTVDIILLKAAGKPVEDELIQNIVSILRTLPSERLYEEWVHLRVTQQLEEERAQYHAQQREPSE